MNTLEAFEIAAKICEDRARELENLLPKAQGGAFATKYAINGLYGCAFLIRQAGKSSMSEKK